MNYKSKSLMIVLSSVLSACNADLSISTTLPIKEEKVAVDNSEIKTNAHSDSGKMIEINLLDLSETLTDPSPALTWEISRKEEPYYFQLRIMDENCHNDLIRVNGIEETKFTLSEALPDGRYCIQVEAKDSQGQTVGTSKKNLLFEIKRPLPFLKSKLVPTIRDAWDYFGLNCDMNDDTLICARDFEGSCETTITHGTYDSADNSCGMAGALNIYRLQGEEWVQEAFIKAPNASAGDRFGFAHALSGNTLAVGTWDEDSCSSADMSDNSCVGAGAVYIFEREDGNWTFKQYLKGHNTAAGDHFGGFLDLNGDRLIVGATGEDGCDAGIHTDTSSGLNDSDCSNANSGAVYTFKRISGSWIQSYYIKSTMPQAGDFFGNLIIDGDTLIVGAWGESSCGSTIVHGSFDDPDSACPSTGAFYSYRFQEGGLIQEAFIKLPHTDQNDFNWSRFELKNDTLVIGASGDDSCDIGVQSGAYGSKNNDCPESGAIYVVVRDNSGLWSQQAYIKPFNTGAGDDFGRHPSLDGDIIAAGSTGEDGCSISDPGDDVCSDVGAVYLFRRIKGQWSPTSTPYFKADDVKDNDFAGFPVVYKNTLIFHHRDGLPTGTGALNIWDIRGLIE